MKRLSLATCVLLFSLAACRAHPPSITPEKSFTQTVVPIIPPTPTVVTSFSPLYQSVVLTHWSFSGGNSPDARINAQTPALTGSLDPRVIKFNHEMSAVVDEVIGQFMYDTNPKELPVDPSLPGSFLHVRFELLSPSGNIFSLKFEITSYVKGAAHPFDYTRTITFDLEKGEDVNLDQLFLPGSDYLGTISTYCIARLSASEIGPVFSAEGAQPDAGNYSN